jgi:hypothetical protein
MGIAWCWEYVTIMKQCGLRLWARFRFFKQSYSRKFAASAVESSHEY